MEHLTLTLGDREKAEALHQEILSLVKAKRAAEVALGKALREMRERGWILFHGVTDFSIYCEQKAGLSSMEGWELAAAAEAFSFAPALEEKVASGKVSLAKATAVGKEGEDRATFGRPYEAR